MKGRGIRIEPVHVPARVQARTFLKKVLSNVEIIDGNDRSTECLEIQDL